jgi:hypothetical protein
VHRGPAVAAQASSQPVIYSRGLYAFQMMSPELLVHKKKSKRDTHQLMWQIITLAKWKRTKTQRKTFCFQSTRLLIKLKPSILRLHFPGRRVFFSQENITTTFLYLRNMYLVMSFKTHYLL